ncbi:MAG: hypothetical protein V3T86_07310 [Planctomycetota bacterium]
MRIPVEDGAALIMKHAVVTLSLGASPIFDETRPLMARYAERIGADFVPIEGPFLSKQECHKRKFELRDLLERYERILFLDNDIAIRYDAPDVFERVPADRLGGTTEGPPLFRSRAEIVRESCAYYGAPDPGERDFWLNTGVMVVSRCHREVFAAPPSEMREFGSGWLDMPLVSARMEQLGLETFELGPAFNYIGSIAFQRGRPFEPYEAYFFHATGALRHRRMDYVRRVIRIWRRMESGSSANFIDRASFRARAAWGRWRRDVRKRAAAR